MLIALEHCKTPLPYLHALLHNFFQNYFFQNLRQECVSAKKLANEAHNVLVDSERKLAVIEEETQRTEERVRAATERVNALENQINDVGGEIRVLEDRDNDAAQREELTEEKMKVGEDCIKLPGWSLVPLADARIAPTVASFVSDARSYIRAFARETSSSSCPQEKAR